jgi:hypothetical protein
VAEYQRAAQNSFREVADALVTVEKLKDVRVELEVSVQALTNSARLARLRYDTGLANYLEILIADQQLFDRSYCWPGRAEHSSAVWCNSTARWAADGNDLERSPLKWQHPSYWPFDGAAEIGGSIDNSERRPDLFTTRSHRAKEERRFQIFPVGLDCIDRDLANFSAG